MTRTREIITKDIKALSDKTFFEKYIVQSENWYLENVLGHAHEEVPSITTRFREIVSKEINVPQESIMIVGSSQIGFSLSPDPQKTLRPFCVDGKERKASDIDVAIISSKDYERFWKLFRKHYSWDNRRFYRASDESGSGIYCEVYRGFINEKNVLHIDGCVKPWMDFCGDSKRKLQDHLFIQNQITYRVYRRWGDFEEYNLKNINKIKEILIKNELESGGKND